MIRKPKNKELEHSSPSRKNKLPFYPYPAKAHNNNRILIHGNVFQIGWYSFKNAFVTMKFVQLVDDFADPVRSDARLLRFLPANHNEAYCVLPFCNGNEKNGWIGAGNLLPMSAAPSRKLN